MTASGVELARASIALAMTGAMNLRMFGPTAQVTYGLTECCIGTRLDRNLSGLPGLRKRSL